PSIERDLAYSVAFSPNGKFLVSGGVTGGVVLWDALTGQEMRPLRSPGTCSHAVVAFAPDGQTVAAGCLGVLGHPLEHSIHLWTVDGKEVACFGGGTSVGALAFSPDGRTLATGGSHGDLHLWDVASGKERLSFLNQDVPVCSVAFSPDGRTVASIGNCVVIL